ncbi:NADH-FMN oxidoreductase RutF, flavin reductase (DIM6/NTAB) family [Carnobacterium alterfunditum]|uniref:NADH-FMN oxidoreductase RutF, flavin reductase (DIM6/NTAB) family n=1 Tax=Carnobacterium alterfunditum TaxID=28230 RepID=A0A1N6HTD3_9LACT|nr:flavin reductase family protein [Carnobacterium alterfunditum]SIO23023.1 NADH-FMN oxidoreductase RutF, flavin reductase (DIM6/NTAB) family [Carnobacterium alterfunditum]
MFHYKAEQLNKKQQYKFISGSVIPRPIAWVTSLSKDGSVVNAAPFSFFSAASNELPLLTVAILRNDGMIKDTARNILDQKEAVIHIVDQAVVEEMNQTSAPLPPDQSELDQTQLTLVDSLSVKVPSIAEAKIRFEGVLHQYVPIKDENDKIITDFFFIRVTDFFFDETIFDQEKEYILTDKLNPVARLAGNQYATLDEEFMIVRPS